MMSYKEEALLFQTATGKPGTPALIKRSWDDKIGSLLKERSEIKEISTLKAKRSNKKSFKDDNALA